MAEKMKASIRKIETFVEETRSEIGHAVNPPTRRAAAVAVIDNPCAGKYVEDLSELMLIGEELGELLTLRAVAALGIPATSVESYGKAAAVGENGELEHAAAILHPKLGAPVRKVLGKGAALIPSSKKRGGLGVALDIPLGHKDAAFVRSHFDGMEVRINDAPRANEIMVAVAVTDSGRPLPLAVLIRPRSRAKTACVSQHKSRGKPPRLSNERSSTSSSCIKCGASLRRTPRAAVPTWLSVAPAFCRLSEHPALGSAGGRLPPGTATLQDPRRILLALAAGVTNDLSPLCHFHSHIPTSSFLIRRISNPQRKADLLVTGTVVTMNGSRISGRWGTGREGRLDRGRRPVPNWRPGTPLPKRSMPRAS
jgi:hypothetical protein